MKFGSDWLSGLRGEDFEHCGQQLRQRLHWVYYKRWVYYKLTL